MLKRRSTSIMKSAPGWAARLSILCMISLLLSACASLNPDYEKPSVSLTSFRALPSEGMTPVFEVKLNILNPNPDPLRLKGAVYTISVQGRDIVKGAGKDFPVIEAYSDETITLTAQANLYAGIRLLIDLVKNKEDGLEYEFEARLDKVGFGRSIRVREKGEFGMDGKNRVEPTKDTISKSEQAPI